MDHPLHLTILPTLLALCLLSPADAQPRVSAPVPRSSAAIVETAKLSFEPVCASRCSAPAAPVSNATLPSGSPTCKTLHRRAA